MWPGHGLSIVLVKIAEAAVVARFEDGVNDVLRLPSGSILRTQNSMRKCAGNHSPPRYKKSHGTTEQMMMMMMMMMMVVFL